jgi:hypothetical protein
MTSQNLESEIEECLYDAKACEQITREFDSTIPPNPIGKYSCDAFGSTEHLNIGFALSDSPLKEQIEPFEIIRRIPGMLFAEQELSHYNDAKASLMAAYDKIVDSGKIRSLTPHSYEMCRRQINEMVQSISDFKTRYSDIMRFTATVSTRDLKESIERSRDYVHTHTLSMNPVNWKRELATERLKLMDKCLESRAGLFSNNAVVEEESMSAETMAVDLYRGRVPLAHDYFSRFLQKYSQNSEPANANARRQSMAAIPFEIAGAVLSYLRALVGISGRAIESNFR